MIKTFVYLLRKFTSSLSFKLSFYAGLIMFLALLIFAYHSISTQEGNLDNRMIGEAVKDSEVIKAAIWNGMMANDSNVIREILETIGRQPDLTEINIYDTAGRLHYSSDRELLKDNSRPITDPDMTAKNMGAAVRHEISKDHNSLKVINPLLNAKSCSTAACHAHPESEKVLGFLELRRGLQSVNEEISSSTRNTIVFVFLLFICISSVVGLAVIFLVNPRIKKLQENAAKMARGEYRPGERSRGSDEMAELQRAFDGMSRQINERTMELDASRKMYKALFDEVPCYLTVVNKSYRIVRANNAFRETFGDVVGMHCFTAYKHLSSKCSNCPVEKTFTDGFSHQSEEVWALDGRKVYVIVKTSPINDELGNVREVLEMSVDVTRLKRLQLELEKKEHEYRYLFEHAPCYLTVVDRDFTIVQSNREFEMDFGRHLGEKCYSVYKSRDTKCDNCPVEKTFADGQNHYSEEVWQRNGQDTYVIVYTAPITDDSGEIVRVMEMSTNITQVKRLQMELAVLGETIAGMSHTIKNVLCGLQGGVYVVDSGITRGKEERIRSGWTMVKNNVEKVSELVKGILYASKEREPEYTEIDPAKLLAEICDLYEERARSEGIELIRAFDSELGPCLLDPASIHSALANLVANAVEACRKVDRSRARHVTVRGCVESERLFLQVGDNGSGMPEEVKEKLFSKFFSTKGSKGTGLGLVITKKVVHEHGGIISVESAPGKGTTFTMEIPRRTSISDSELKAVG